MSAPETPAGGIGSFVVITAGAAIATALLVRAFGNRLAAALPAPAAAVVEAVSLAVDSVAPDYDDQGDDADPDEQHPASFSFMGG